MSRLLISLILTLFAVPAFAAQQAGQISKYEGPVSIYRDGAVRGEKVIANDQPLFVGDSVKTKRGGRAFISFVDGSKIVLQEDSSLLVKNLENANVAQGTVLFEIKKRGQAQGLLITSATVTMGVRGTRFAVSNAEDNVSIFLKTGELEIGALEGEFKKQKEDLEKDFKEMQEKMKKDFQNTQAQMKAYFDEASKQMREGNFEIVKNFNMTSGSAVAISNNE
ncbi:MAG: FecR family protein, partial [Proteobacteria bacterium]|nr:FecR family protein [Pseudomonadota bacterium]